ncbi:hypothetical protein HPP92_015469 [Vanilla planifolia]|uniref:histidinol-phosphate transaminase n=1 Tax=Vanilla planifolia TaxID=51239 RepID=A0A835QQ60_VANPL|nr:hypothetical protein HPP92_015469 [Vanilla planifolia]
MPQGHPPVAMKAVSISGVSHFVGRTSDGLGSFCGNRRRLLASAMPAEQVDGAPCKVTGDSFIRLHLKKLSPYQPILPFEVLSTRLRRKPEDIIKLDANENPYGPPPEASDKIVDCPPTFTMYEFDAAVNGALVIKVPREPNFSLNIPHIINVVEREKPKCIFLTSPNNPDGSVISDEDLLKVLDLPILVILDEAYIEFSGLKSRMDWVKKHDNLIVLRTFSKRAGLAGLRVGYGAFPLSIIKYFWRAKQPYNVSVTAEVAACAALQNPGYLERVKNLLVLERERLYKLLEEVPYLKPFPSFSNFILCEVTSGKDAKKLKEDLAQHGVMIRHYNNKELSGYVRISARMPKHRDALMKCLKLF